MSDEARTAAVSMRGVELSPDASISRVTRTMVFVELTEPVPVGTEVMIASGAHETTAVVERVFEQPSGEGAAGMWLRIHNPRSPLGGGEDIDPSFPEPAAAGHSVRNSGEGADAPDSESD